jgi:upstream activation factor subunit UAF30
MATKKNGRKGAKTSSGRSSAPKKKTSAPKTAAKAKSAGGAKKASGAKARKPNAAFMKPVQPDAALAKVVGDEPMPRTEITKRLWAYVKKKKLQDANDKRSILADELLGPVFDGKKKVTMFEMTSYVNKHLRG